MIKRLLKSISFKYGLLFSSLFLILLLLLGYILYGLFSYIYIGYITQDIMIRGENHSKVLERNFNETSINHVSQMEQDVFTSVIVTDANKQILINSDPIEDEMRQHIANSNDITSNEVLNQDWKSHQFIVVVSPINEGKLGYVYMYYPTNVLKETVFFLQGFIAIASIGVIFIAFGLIIILSKKMTHPLLKMKDATNKMAKGDYRQALQIKGEDELAELANSIQTLGEQLQYYEDTRNEFLASVSHELRTPLSYIKGYSDVLNKGIIKDNEEQKKYLKIINEETKRITHLVNDLFDMSKIQTGQFKLMKESIKCTSLLEKVIHNLSPLAKEKGLIIAFNSDPDVPNLHVDPIRMEQVFFNLIENAIKYTDNGKINVGVKLNKDFIIITVEDTGIGIPEKDLPRIWERFYRVEKSRARKTGGTGLGLFVVKEIIQLHGGQIEVNSFEGKGTKFTIKHKRKDVVI